MKPATLYMHTSKRWVTLCHSITNVPPLSGKCMKHLLRQLVTDNPTSCGSACPCPAIAVLPEACQPGPWRNRHAAGWTTSQCNSATSSLAPAATQRPVRHAQHVLFTCTAVNKTPRQHQRCSGGYERRTVCTATPALWYVGTGGYLQHTTGLKQKPSLCCWRGCRKHSLYTCRPMQEALKCNVVFYPFGPPAAPPSGPR